MELAKQALCVTELCLQSKHGACEASSLCNRALLAEQAWSLRSKLCVTELCLQSKHGACEASSLCNRALLAEQAWSLLLPIYKQFESIIHDYDVI